ncbi:hypothetical protein CEXT_504101 [Caerostris extrusa]|uniref:Uncharacterized protein n=1 Tax=Caerostris extrusa TaxID=172846 RepID=A0AAV4NZC3_CAEEX|nr:hypothetical protein CEXT_504101 [Caerostris extrusa]
MSAKDVVETYLWKDEPSFRIRDQNDLPIQGIYPDQLIILDVSGREYGGSQGLGSSNSPMVADLKVG